MTEPLATSLRGLWVSGNPSSGNGGQKGGDPRIDQATKSMTETPGWHPKKPLPCTCPTRGTLRSTRVAFLKKESGHVRLGSRPRRCDSKHCCGNSGWNWNAPVSKKKYDNDFVYDNVRPALEGAGPMCRLALLPAKGPRWLLQS